MLFSFYPCLLNHEVYLFFIFSLLLQVVSVEFAHLLPHPTILNTVSQFTQSSFSLLANDVQLRLRELSRRDGNILRGNWWKRMLWKSFYGHDKFIDFLDSKQLWLPTQGLHKPLQMSVLLAEEHLRAYASGAIKVRKAASFSFKAGATRILRILCWMASHPCMFGGANWT